MDTVPWKATGQKIKWEPPETYVSKSGDLIIKNDLKLSTDTLGNTTTLYNNGIEIWKKQQDGSWKHIVDIYNGDP